MCPSDLEACELRKVLASVLDRHRGKWLRFVHALLRDAADAEDVLQEAVRRVLVRARPFPSEEGVRMYLARTISNTAIEAYNSRKRDRLRNLPLYESRVVGLDSTTPHTFMEQNERLTQRDRLLRLLNEGLSRLPVKQYEALRITVLEAELVSIRDAGELYGIPYSTLRHRSVQGLRSLRKFLHKALRSGEKASLANSRESSNSTSKRLIPDP